MPETNRNQRSSNCSPKLFRGLLGAIVVSVLTISIMAILVWTSSEPEQNGQPVSYWISKLGFQNSGSHAALDELGPENTLPYLLQTVRGEKSSPSQWDRLYSRVYRRIPSAVRQKLSVPRFSTMQELLDGGEFTQRKTAEYVAGLGERYPSTYKIVVPELVPLLGSTNRNTRFSAAVALRGYGTNSAPAIPTLVELLENDPKQLHDVMFRLLVDCGSGAAVAVPALRSGAAGDDILASIHCSRTLVELDPSQADFVRPIALRMSESDDPGVRIEAATLLWKIDGDPERVVPMLVEQLQDNDDTYDYRTILFLEKMGPQAGAAIPALSKWISGAQSQEAFVIERAAQALQAMGGQK